MKFGPKFSPNTSRPDMETIASLYKLLAMADGPKLPAENFDAKNLKIHAFTDTTMKKAAIIQDKCFLDPRINKHFMVKKEILIFKATKLP